MKTEQDGAKGRQGKAVTPERIEHLFRNDVFVFGSNLAGAHANFC